MFETAEERVKLLKTGLSGKEIERLYIEHNNFKIIRTPILCEANEIDIVRYFDNEGCFENPQITRAFNQVIVIPIPATSPRKLVPASPIFYEKIQGIIKLLRP